MDDPHHQYGITDLRQLMNGGVRLTSSSPSSSHIPSDLFGFNLALAHDQQQHQHDHHHHNHHQQYQEMSFVPRGGLRNDYINSIATSSGGTASGGGGGFSGLLDGVDGGGTGRWPRQETLTLLEIRSRLDLKFKEANQKGPLWDEVSRIMSDEHGYQRSGKKCREKFENLYKYYKKTKEGKAGRQDGKHYRFFRQLEALYGDSSNSVSLPETQFIRNNLHFNASTNNTSTLETHNNQEALNNIQAHQKLSIDNSLSLSNHNSSEFSSSSSDDNETDSSRRRRRNWKAKIKEFIDAQMKKLIERQEAWLEKLTKTIEEKEQERMTREQEWRKQDAARTEKERRFWAKEREWMENRDATLIEALQNLTGRRLVKAASSSPEEMINNGNENGSDQTMTTNVSVKGDTGWTESEITRLIELRTSMDSRFQQVNIPGCSDEIFWEEISAKLACLGYDRRSALMCKEKWECINNYMRRSNKESNKKRKEYFPKASDQTVYNHGNGYDCDQINGQCHVETLRSFQGNNNDDVSSPSNSNIGNGISSGCFPFLLGDGDQNLWESYGLRPSKGEN